MQYEFSPRCVCMYNFFFLRITSFFSEKGERAQIFSFFWYKYACRLFFQTHQSTCTGPSKVKMVHPQMRFKSFYGKQYQFNCSVFNLDDSLLFLLLTQGKFKTVSAFLRLTSPLERLVVKLGQPNSSVTFAGMLFW